MSNRRFRLLLVVLALVVTAAGCRSMDYSRMEMIGREKRHILKSNIEDVSDAQNEAAEQFKDTLTRLKEMYGFEGGERCSQHRRVRTLVRLG